MILFPMERGRNVLVVGLPKSKVTIRTGFTSTVLVFNTSVLDKQCTGFCPGFSRWQPIFLNCNKSISG
jgi:hypothetical protein